MCTIEEFLNAQYRVVLTKKLAETPSNLFHGRRRKISFAKSLDRVKHWFQGPSTAITLPVEQRPRIGPTPAPKLWGPAKKAAKQLEAEEKAKLLKEEEEAEQKRRDAAFDEMAAAGLGDPRKGGFGLELPGRYDAPSDALRPQDIKDPAKEVQARDKGKNKIVVAKETTVTSSERLCEDPDEYDPSRDPQYLDRLEDWGFRNPFDDRNQATATTTTYRRQSFDPGMDLEQQLGLLRRIDTPTTNNLAPTELDPHQLPSSGPSVPPFHQPTAHLVNRTINPNNPYAITPAPPLLSCPAAIDSYRDAQGIWRDSVTNRPVSPLMTHELAQFRGLLRPGQPASLEPALTVTAGPSTQPLPQQQQQPDRSRVEEWRRSLARHGHGAWI